MGVIGRQERRGQGHKQRKVTLTFWTVEQILEEKQCIDIERVQS